MKVLHVDDDPMNLRVVQEILRAFGHTAVSAVSGQEAIDLMNVDRFDAVLMDIHMPEMTGIETLEKLRSSGGPAGSTPTIALTADVYSRKPSDYEALGFAAYLTKPIMVAKLMDTLRRCIAESAAPATLRHAG